MTAQVFAKGVLDYQSYCAAPDYYVQIPAAVQMDFGGQTATAVGVTLQV